MIVEKIGKLEVIRKKDSYGNDYGKCEVEMLVRNVNGRNFVTTAVVKDTSMYVTAPYMANTYRGINPENEESLLILLQNFAYTGVESYKWIEPLTEA